MVINSENKIYHYCKLNTAIESILAERQLLLSELGKTNDPRENKSFVFAAAFGPDTDFKDLKTNNLEVSNFLREGCKVICFSHDDSPFLGYEYSKMWAHYGDNHRGICIELNKDIFLQENSSIARPDLLKEIDYLEFDITMPREEHKLVDYLHMKAIGKEEYLKELFRAEHLEYLYFTKDKDWGSERETRLLYFSNKNENEYCSIEKSINHIYLGVDFNKNYLPSIIHLCPNVPISELQYNEVRLTASQLKLE